MSVARVLDGVLYSMLNLILVSHFWPWSGIAQSYAREEINGNLPVQKVDKHSTFHHDFAIFELIVSRRECEDYGNDKSRKNIDAKIQLAPVVLRHDPAAPGVDLVLGFLRSFLDLQWLNTKLTNIVLAIRILGISMAYALRFSLDSPNPSTIVAAQFRVLLGVYRSV